VQRHSCDLCRRTYSGRDALPVAGSGYARAVRRLAVDHRQHFGGSVRRAAERLRSLLGRQERRLIRRPPDGPPTPEAECRPSAAAVERWLDRAGAAAEATVEGQLAGVATSGQVATDGLWARRRDGKAEVLLGLVDSATGLLWPPAAAEGEGEAAHRQALLDRAERAGLALDSLRGVVGDGAQGLSGYPGRALDWVDRQRRVFHLWRNLAGELRARANAAAAGLAGAAARAVRREARRELVALVRAVLERRIAGAGSSPACGSRARSGASGGFAATCRRGGGTCKRCWRLVTTCIPRPSARRPCTPWPISLSARGTMPPRAAACSNSARSPNSNATDRAWPPR
jgi:hypothetical protein